MPPPDTRTLDLPLIRLRGVGPERSAQLARLGLQTVEDLLLLRPRRHEDRRNLVVIRDLRTGQTAATRGRVVAQGLKKQRKPGRSLFEILLEDGTGRLACRWWNLPYMERYFSVGAEVMVYGRVGAFRPLFMDHPETEVVENGDEMSIHLDRVVPVYPLTEGLPQRWLRALLWRTLAEWEARVAEPWPESVSELLGRMPSRRQAVRWLHFPDEPDQAELARQRLALDELTEIQLRLQTRRRNLEAKSRALPCAGDNRLIKPFLAGLGFALTEAQTTVLREIRQDLRGPHPMRRLLQGDVGSGKTVVSACAALMALESGYNVALMAPTQILAEQHFQTFARWLQPLGVALRLETGEVSNRVGQSADATGVQAQRVMTLGTHALLEPAVELPRLGLVVIDEQHKFGVAQRETLLRKGVYPHLLAMTATPIPRTLGLTLYGDLDVSVIRQMPPGRGRVRTFVRGPAQLPRVHEFVLKKIAEGRQACVVYARIEDTDLKASMKSVTQEFQRLEKEFAPHRVGLLHGRMPGPEKEAVMRAFRAGEIQILLATSVIEVGVDVPNATVMLVENAEQFGLAQLHQLRGRIGRGAHESYCVLLANRQTPEARQRLRVLEQSADGFFIAEADLKLRGPGDFLGREQSGLPPLRFANLAGDLPLVEQARLLAARLLSLGASAPTSGSPAPEARANGAENNAAGGYSTGLSSR